MLLSRGICNSKMNAHVLFSVSVGLADTLRVRMIPLCRCLDESEESAPGHPPPPPPPPGVPDCPICGKKFKSQKSRSAHMKRCSSDMGVSPAVLLQALHRQAEETQTVPTNAP